MNVLTGFRLSFVVLLLNIVQLFYNSTFFITIEKEKEVKDLTLQLRDRDKEIETLQQKLKGNCTKKLIID